LPELGKEARTPKDLAACLSTLAARPRALRIPTVVVRLVAVVVAVAAVPVAVDPSPSPAG
jgi:hypothetical protein